MNSVFVLQHSYEQDEYDETKFIGVYSTKIEAENAINRLSKQNGFKYRTDGFVIDEYELDKDHWTEGFVTIASIQVKSKSNKWMTVSAERLPGDKYLIIQKHENEQLEEFKDGDIVKCKEESGELYAIESINKGT